MKCPHSVEQRQHPEYGTMHRCALIASESGGTVWIPESKCLTCSQSDDGKSHASKCIEHTLKRRVVVGWRENECKSCSGDTPPLTSDEAFPKLLKRVGDDAAAEVLIKAVEAGMPQARAEEIAKATLPEASL